MKNIYSPRGLVLVKNYLVLIAGHFYSGGSIKFDSWLLYRLTV